MATLIDRDYMLLQIEKAKAENRTFDYDSLIDFVNALPTVDKSTELEEIKEEIEELLEHCDSDYEFEEIYGIKLCLEILEEHIKELDNDV